MKLDFIPLDKLVVSKANMRYGKKAPDVSDILPTVRSRGVIQPVIVRPNCAPDGYEIVAGSRRFHAAKIVADERRATGDADPDAAMLPCAILDDGDDADAIEASMIENMARLDPDEVTQWENFIRTMQREFSRAATMRAQADQAIYDPAAPDARPLVGRVLARGLADEHADRHYLIVDGVDGRSHYVAVGTGAETDAALSRGSIVRVEPIQVEIREVDRTIAQVAAANGGRYDVDAHLRHDPTATEAFAETHVRRLEAMRRMGGIVEREPSGRWIIAPDHLGRVATYETARLRDRPVAITMLSAQPLDKLVDVDAATWIDRELVSGAPEPVRDAGFGHDLRETQARRRQWLVAQGFAEEAGGNTTFSSGMIATLQRRELLRVAGQLADELKTPFGEAVEGTRIDGVYRRSVDLVSGRFALIERARDFTLVPWRPVLERQVGKSVSGLMRGDGISWSIGRGRNGPTIS